MNDLKQAIKEKARQLGFHLAGVTSSEPPAYFPKFEAWLEAGMHGRMEYLSSERSRHSRADPKHILPECKSILVLGIPYPPPASGAGAKIASYALGRDYHDVLPDRLKSLVSYIEAKLVHPFPYKLYTDSGPILERELGQRAGLGWIGKNSCLIHPNRGSTFFMAEILLGIELEADEPFPADHCGSCTRCEDACPTQCILPDRTLDARRCISYLTIELKEEIPTVLRPQIGNWVFGCDICQQVCPWNRFAPTADPAFEPLIPLPLRTSDLRLTQQEFRTRFNHTPVKRAKRAGFLRNLSVVTGNTGDETDIPLLEDVSHQKPFPGEHAHWAIGRIHERSTAQ